MQFENKLLIRLTLFLIFSTAVGVIRLLAQDSSHQVIRIMSYNIWYDNPNNTGNLWLDRVDGVLKTLEDYNPAILGVQEALSNQVDDLKRAGFSYYGKGRDDGDKAGEQTAIFFKPGVFNLINGDIFWLSENPDSAGSVGWDAVLPRTVTWVKLQNCLSEEILYVFNTHFSHVGEEARLKSAELLMEKIAEISGNASVILMGDFNCKLDSYPYETIISHSNSRKLSDARFMTEDPFEGVDYTYVGADFEGKPGSIIDHIFVSDDVFIQKAYSYWNCNDGRCPSDHLPVVALIQVK